MSDLASEYLILWASQTGNAEWIAKNIHTEALKKGYKGQCLVMDDYTTVPFQDAKVIILVSSNTGDGDAPDNSLKFWRFLRRNKDKAYFTNTRFTVLGLGDSNYSNFNNTGKKLEKKFKELGATVFYEKALADDAEGLENTVDPWIENLWKILPTVLKQDTNASTATTELEEKMTELKLNPSSIPYSMADRVKNLPEPVQKYTQLENSIIHTQPAVAKDMESSSGGDGLEEFAKGSPLNISLEGLEMGAKLTGLPRVSVPVAKLSRLEGRTMNEELSGKVPNFVPTPTPITYAPVTMVACLTAPDAVKRTLEIELDVGEDMHYEPGDAFGVLAPNDERLVEAVLNRLKIKPEDYQQLYQVEGDNLPSHLKEAKEATLHQLFTYGVDLTSQPRKALFRMLADYTSDPKEKLTLMYICSKQGAAAFNAVRDQSPNLLDILDSFPSCQPPIERLLDLLPAHMPRYYSISSSPLKRQGKIRFAFNVVEYITSNQVQRKGVATPWLDKLTELVPSRTTPLKTEIAVTRDIRVPVFVRQNANAFVLPQETERPLILIGPGTGIAPFIGFLEHRQAQRQIRLSMGGIGHQPTQQIRKAFGPIYVYYGFRDKHKDFLFENDLKNFKEDGTITHLSLAESRAVDGSPRVYVQDLIRKDADVLFDLIVNKGAAIYICGDAKGMAKGVQDALVDILVEHQKIDVVEANKLLMSWIASKKYLRDLWA
ncbi:hypothetical protein EDC96DRAFT_605898 [Choanephora cucurbitarum]|nr:hypothetical protein EDC96DRAFT_605898 [Choanephora cucurbitarum]